MTNYDSQTETSEEEDIEPKNKNFLTHKRLRKFLNENNLHLDGNQYNKRVKSNLNSKEEILNIYRQATGTTRADSVEALVNENEKLKQNIAGDDLKYQEIGKKDSCEELKEKTEQLLLSKIELPSSSLNKSITSSLDHINELIINIKTDDLYEVL